MSQTISLAGATYSDVPSVQLPKQGGGYASFMDTTDADATAEDILENKTAYVNGVKLTGTGSGGGGSSTKYGIALDNLIGNTNASGVLQQPTGGNVDLNISGVKGIVTYGFHYKFSRNTAVRSVVFPDLETLGTTYALNYAFYTCTNLATASFPKLTAISGSNAFAYSFYGCSAMTSVSLPLLASVTGASGMQYAFYNCANLETLSFPVLTTIGSSSSTSTHNRHFYNAFYGCSKLTSISFPELTTVYCNGNGTSYGSFAGNNKVKKLFFPKLVTMTYSSGYTNANRNQPLENMFASCGALQEIHFALTNKTAVEAMVGYSTKWAAPASCQILFDL